MPAFVDINPASSINKKSDHFNVVSELFNIFKALVRSAAGRW